MQIIVWTHNSIYHTLKYRNVGDRNPGAQIQITYERYNSETHRNLPTIFIDIPKEQAQKFIEGLRE
jgi:hypothetical protein